MAFNSANIKKLAEISGVSWYQYTTTDTLAIATAAGYFNSYAPLVDKNDQILIIASDGATLQTLTAVTTPINIQGVAAAGAAANSVTIEPVTPTQAGLTTLGQTDIVSSIRPALTVDGGAAGVSEIILKEVNSSLSGQWFLQSNSMGFGARNVATYMSMGLSDGTMNFTGAQTTFTKITVNATVTNVVIGGNALPTIEFSPSTGSTKLGVVFQNADQLSFGDSSTTQVSLYLDISKTPNTNVVVGASGIATNATDGFIHIPSITGTPTGVPTAYAGHQPLVYDRTNNKLYIYNAGWKTTTVFA